jgi:hypothetical protein
MAGVISPRTITADMKTPSKGTERIGFFPRPDHATVSNPEEARHQLRNRDVARATWVILPFNYP